MLGYNNHNYCNSYYHPNSMNLYYIHNVLWQCFCIQDSKYVLMLGLVSETLMNPLDRMRANNNKEMNQELRKQEFKDRINLLVKIIHEFEGRPRDTSEGGVKQVDHVVYAAIVHVLKQFAIDRNFEGKKPEWLVSSAHTRQEISHTRFWFFSVCNDHQYSLITILEFCVWLL